MKTDWQWLRYAFIVGLAIGGFLTALLILSGLVHAVSLKNYTTYNSTGGVSGNITIDADDFQVEVKNQMGAVALALLAATFAYLFANVKSEHHQPLRILFIVASLLMASIAAFVTAQQNAKASTAIDVTSRVLEVTLAIIGLYIVYNVLQLVIDRGRGFTGEKKDTPKWRF